MRSRSWLRAVPAVAVTVGGVAAGAVHYFAGSPGMPNGELAAMAFGAPWVMAGVLTLVGTIRGCPTVVAFAGMAAFPISLVSIVLWPLLVPALLLVAQGVSRFNHPAPRDIGVGFLIAIGLVSAFFLLLVHQDPATWQTPEGGTHYSSDIITAVEALASLAIVVTVGVAAAATMLFPRRRS